MENLENFFFIFFFKHACLAGTFSQDHPALILNFKSLAFNPLSWPGTLHHLFWGFVITESTCRVLQHFKLSVDKNQNNYNFHKLKTTIQTPQPHLTDIFPTRPCSGSISRGQGALSLLPWWRGKRRIPGSPGWHRASPRHSQSCPAHTVWRCHPCVLGGQKICCCLGQTKNLLLRWCLFRLHYPELFLMDKSLLRARWLSFSGVCSPHCRQGELPFPPLHKWTTTR